MKTKFSAALSATSSNPSNTQSNQRNKKMGTLGFEPRSAGFFLEAYNIIIATKVTHRSKTGAGYSSQVILCPHLEC